MSVDTMSALHQQVSKIRIALEPKSADEDSDFTKSHIRTHIGMLRNLLLRSQSNKERLQNEIALVSSSRMLFKVE